MFYSMGIMSYLSHDPCCALIRVDGGEVDLIFAEEGFLSRKKKSYQFPLRAMKYCLDHFGITIDAVDILMLDFMDHKRTFRTSNNYRLLLGDYIRSNLKIDPVKIKFAKSHHYAHALTAFWPSSFDEAAVLVVDGLGSQQQTHSVFYMNESGVCNLLFEQKGTGIGLVYALITSSLGFDIGEEGKTMGLAPYGAPYATADADLPSLRGEFNGLLTDYSNVVFRHPTPRLKFDLLKPSNIDDVYGPYFSRLSFNLQRETERCLIHLAKHSLSAAEASNLCFAGGVALNCVANSRIQELEEVKGLYVQPASGDTGVPIGLALAGIESAGLKLPQLLNSKNRKKLGVPYSSDASPLEELYRSELECLLNAHNIPRHAFESKKIANYLADKRIVALFTEGIELGPRALGHRSFLADARDTKMKDLLNIKIKHREAYRPFAPIILENKFAEYFESSSDRHPYMLQAPRCTKKARATVPAICHVDGSARVQTVTGSIGKVNQILEDYYLKTKVPVLINTSFNDNDEPIVFTKLDALAAFLKCGSDVLILEDKVIKRKEIRDEKLLGKEVSNLQQSMRDQYFRDALSFITKIDESYTKGDLIRFITFNLNLSLAYRSERIVIKFLDYLLNRNREKLLYLDRYHEKQIANMASIINQNYDDLCGDTIIINDDTKGLESIQKNSDFILYNMSAHYHNKCLQNVITINEGIQSFYNLDDKIVNIEFRDNENILSPEGVIEHIMESYEHDIIKTIDDFFNEQIK